MTRRRRISCWFSAFGLLILILDGRTALSGAADGIELCMKAVIPALFPFFVLSSVFLRGGVQFAHLDKKVSSLFGLPQGAGSLLIPCFLGGYPVGAKSVYQAYTDGILNKTEAERLLAFCNNAGPAFVFGVIGQIFQKQWMPWALWGIHIIGALFAVGCVPDSEGGVCFDKQPVKSKGDLMTGAVRTTGIVCGWIVLFRVIIAFLDRWILWMLPQTARVALVGLLELSNGCCELNRVSDAAARFILCSGMLAAGGVCVTAQTISVTPGLSLRYYCVGKMIQVLVSLALSVCVMYRIVAPLLLLPLFYLNRKKRSGKRMLSGV